MEDAKPAICLQPNPCPRPMQEKLARMQDFANLLPLARSISREAVRRARTPEQDWPGLFWRFAFAANPFRRGPLAAAPLAGIR